MIYVTFERTVRRRPETVWALMTDLTAAPTWVEGLVDVRVAGAAKLEVAAWLEVEERVAGSVERFNVLVTAFRPGSLLALETRLASGVLLDRVTLTPVAEGTELGVFAELKSGSGLASALAPAPGLHEASAAEQAMRTIYERSFDALVTRIERQSAIPYR